MLSKIKQESFEKLVTTSSIEELIWMDGFLTGTLSSRRSKVFAQSQQPSETIAPSKLTIVYGTETGNAKGLANRLGAIAKNEGVTTNIISLDQYRIEGLVKEQYLVVIISTQGDGEPPVAAKKFYDYMHSTKIQLSQLRYGVIALGDSSYPLFCQAGKDVDDQLHRLGASPIQPIQLCDTNYEEIAQTWFSQTLHVMRENKKATIQKTKDTRSVASLHKKYYRGIVRRNINLNDIGSEKKTHHIELEAEGVIYEPGDSMGIIPKNPVVLVNRILEITGADASLMINYKNENTSIIGLLQEKLNISYLAKRTVKKYADITGQEIPDVSISLVDLLTIYPINRPEQFAEVLQILDPITPRLYSISSSLSAYEHEVHITVKLDEFEHGEGKGSGLCSDYLTGLAVDTEIDFYIHSNKRFRLPEDERDIIMIAAGTGIAPFRSFIAERASKNATGRNWLFFGDQHFTTDFLYQTEWQNYKELGVLTHINTAFSRDQKEKIYIQHKISEYGEALYDWIENGASIYICGAREPMSEDVHHSILDVISLHGKKSKEEAQVYLDLLEESERYLKDVY